MYCGLAGSKWLKRRCSEGPIRKVSSSRMMYHFFRGISLQRGGIRGGPHGHVCQSLYLERIQLPPELSAKPVRLIIVIRGYRFLEGTVLGETGVVSKRRIKLGLHDHVHNIVHSRQPVGCLNVASASEGFDQGGQPMASAMACFDEIAEVVTQTQRKREALKLMERRMWESWGSKRRPRYHEDG
ncbi:hypothetical protein TgHK011_006436 [Trichoderma gracile]|nr:hypothetical protein TgHK011_006436 [Trichoderma gracile]